MMRPVHASLSKRSVSMRNTRVVGGGGATCGGPIVRGSLLHAQRRTSSIVRIANLFVIARSMYSAFVRERLFGNGAPEERAQLVPTFPARNVELEEFPGLVFEVIANTGEMFVPH